MHMVTMDWNTNRRLHAGSQMHRPDMPLTWKNLRRQCVHISITHTQSFISPYTGRRLMIMIKNLTKTHK